MKLGISSMLGIVFLFQTLSFGNEARSNLYINHLKKMQEHPKKNAKILFKTEADKIIANMQGRPTQEFAKKFEATVYALSDGSYIVAYEYLYRQYRNRQHVLDMLNGGSYSEHILRGVSRSGENFPSEAKMMLGPLVKRFNLDPSKLDYTEKSLYHIDITLMEAYESGTISKYDLYEHLMGFIAYAGEVYIRQYGGRWQMELYKDGETWQPYIVTTKGKKLNLFTCVADDILYFDEMEDGTPGISPWYLAKVNNFLIRD
jgi:hypothetical protein